MAIQVSLDAVLRNRSMTLTELSHRTGITLANLSILKTGKSRMVRFSTLAAICRELSCSPGDLLGCAHDAAANFEADVQPRTLPSASDTRPCGAPPPPAPTSVANRFSCAPTPRSTT